jgi:MFS transporter, AAHS family, 4-hydroxybenzoate transporter
VCRATSAFLPGPSRISRLAAGLFELTVRRPECYCFRGHGGGAVKTIDLAALLDDGRWSNYQKLLIFGTALAITLDGIDNQLLPNVVPTLMGEWNLPRAAFADALAAGPFGMLIGALLGGVVGDRLGRRTAIVGSAVIFGVVTLGLAFVGDVSSLLVLRLLAGIGLGGAIPNAAALASEYVPRRNRPFAISLVIVCTPLGGFIAGQMAAAIIAPYGWRTLFIIGGAVPVVVAAVLFKLLPESPRFLVMKRARWPELRRALRRLGHDVPDDAELVDSAAAVPRWNPKGAAFAAMFSPSLRLDTIGLFGAFFFCLMTVYIGFQLIPVLLTGMGFTPAQGSQALSYFNFGGVLGAVISALLVQRLGSRLTMLGMAALGVVAALAMVANVPSPDAVLSAMLMFAITGALINAVQTAMFALATHVYPTQFRGTGVGTAVAIGRVGNVLAVYVGNYAISLGGPPAYFSSWAITMGLVFVSLAIVRHHIPRSSGVPAGEVAPARQ